jgi:hypothetical protein
MYVDVAVGVLTNRVDMFDMCRSIVKCIRALMAFLVTNSWQSGFKGGEKLLRLMNG